ncbi:MAG: uroporphyrinogen decarboxylase family protein [Coriobacteriales bacterium]|jgi:hypothetical protein
MNKTKIPMNLDSEMKVKGMYGQLDDWYGYPYAPVQRINTPISPKENYLNYLNGKDYEWVPDVHADKVEITPHCIPDIVACGFSGGKDSFGVNWVLGPNPELPAFPEEGVIKLDDISNWRSLEFPDVDSWGWEEESKRYREFYKDDDRSFRGVIMIGFFERMISLMGFENAAMALLEDPEETVEFLNAVADVNIKMADHYIDDFGCDSILFHDDWSSQNGQFFSTDTAMNVLVPPVKKLVDHIKSRGAVPMFHSCGNGLKLVPAYKATGVRVWQAQYNVYDLKELIEACGDDIIVEIYPDLEEEVTEDELESVVADYLKYAKLHRFSPEIVDFKDGRWEKTRLEFYRQARTLAVESQSA